MVVVWARMRSVCSLLIEVGHINGPDVPLEIVNVLPVGHLKRVKGPDVLADAVDAIALKSEPTNELVNGGAVDLVSRVQLVC